MAVFSSIGGLTAGSVVFAGSSGLLAQDNANFFWDDTNNRLGIGTTTPENALELSGGIPNVLCRRAGNPGGVVGVRCNGSIANPTGVLSGQDLFQFQGRGHDGTAFGTTVAATILLQAAENFSTTAYGGRIRFSVCKMTTTTTAPIADFYHDNTSAIFDFSVMADTRIKASTSTGLRIGTATTQKLAFYDSTPIVQPSLIGSTLTYADGTATDTLQSITGVNTLSQTAVENNFQDIVTKLNNVITTLKNLGLSA